MSDTPLKELGKREAMQRLLEDGMVFVQLDPTAPGVDVPATFHDQPVLGLNFSYAFHIPDFNVGEEGIMCTLQFNPTGDHCCFIPWASLFAMTSKVTEDGRFFLEDMPAIARLELAQRAVIQLAAAQQSGGGTVLKAEANPEKAEEAAPGLRVISGGQEPAPLKPVLEEEEPDEPPPSPDKKRGHLRLIR